MSLISELGFLIVAGSAVYHVGMGTFCLFDRKILAKVTKLFYKLEMPKQEHAGFEYMLKPLGLFALWTGFICALAICRPGPWVVELEYSLAALYLSRSALRFFYRQLLLDAFQITWARSRWNVIFNMVISATLLASAVQG